MMMRHGRKHLGLAALLAVLLLGAWFGVAPFHEHAGAPSCEICKSLHFSAADVVAPAALIQPVDAILPFTSAPLPAASTPYLSTPPGRAPPLA